MITPDHCLFLHGILAPDDVEHCSQVGLSQGTLSIGSAQGLNVIFSDTSQSGITKKYNNYTDK